MLVSTRWTRYVKIFFNLLHLLWKLADIFTLLLAYPVSVFGLESRLTGAREKLACQFGQSDFVELLIAIIMH